jgi:hypothetical protein
LPKITSGEPVRITRLMIQNRKTFTLQWYFRSFFISILAENFTRAMLR